MYDLPGVGKVSLDQINQWRNGHLMQADYTRKTQQLAQQRDALRNREAQIEDAARKLVLWYQQQMQQGRPTQAEPEPETDDPYLQEINKLRKTAIDPIQQRVAQFEQMMAQQQEYIQQQQVTQEETRITGELNALREEFPLMQDWTVLAWYQQQPDGDLRRFAQASHELVQKQINDVLAQQQGQVQQQQAVRRSAPPRAGSPPNLALKKPATMEEAHVQAMAALNALP
jgi:hypothetical protein